LNYIQTGKNWIVYKTKTSMKLITAIALMMLTLPSLAQQYTIENNEVKMNKAISFKTGTDKLEASSKDALVIIQQLLADKPAITTLRIEGHSDNTGNAAANQLLTEKRAVAVCKALVAMGVDCKRLLPVGFGGNKPIADNSSPEGKTKNRRINFVIAALRNRMIGGIPADGGGKVAGNACTE
jgi:OmpA-OmpF porin, OOP family